MKTSEAILITLAALFCGLALAVALYTIPEKQEAQKQGQVCVTVMPMIYSGVTSMCVPENRRYEIPKMLSEYLIPVVPDEKEEKPTL